jgi:hypothetical protein
MTDRELLQQALGYMDSVGKGDMYAEEWAIAEAIRTRLAQPELKPISWGVQEGANLHDVFLFKDEADEMCDLKGTHAKAVPLYTAPPKKEWVGLTYEDMIKIWNELYKGDDVLPTTFGMAIEAKLKEKNSE